MKTVLKSIQCHITSSTPLLAVAAGMIIGSALWLWPNHPPQKNKKKAPLAVTATQLHQANYQPQLLIYGQIQVPHMTHIESRITGNILSVETHVGDYVEKGQVLMQLDGKDIELKLNKISAQLLELDARIDAEKAELATAEDLLSEQQTLYEIKKRSLGRQQYLKNAHAIADNKLDESKASLSQERLAIIQRKQSINRHQYKIKQLLAQKSNLEAEQNLTQRDHDSAQVTSPFSGRVTQVLMATGSKAQPGERLVDLFDYDSLEIRAQIPFKHLEPVLQQHQSKKMLQAKSTLHGKPYSLMLARLSSLVANGQSGIDGYFSIQQGDINSLALGENTNLLLALPPIEHSFAIPITALHPNNQVYKIQNGHLNPIDITVHGKIYHADHSHGWIITSNQLNTGDQILSTQVPSMHRYSAITINQSHEYPFNSNIR